MPTEIATEEKPFSLAEEIAKEQTAAETPKEDDDGQVQSAEETEEVAEADSEETDEATEEEKTQQQVDENKRLIAWMKDNFGEDLGGKYKSDAEAIRGLLNAAKMVGQRDEDAEYGRKIRQKYGDVDSIINAVGTKKEEPKEEEPVDWKSYQLMRAQITDENGAIRANADPATVRKVNQIAEDFNRRMFDLAFSTDKVIAPALEKIKPALNKELEQLQAQEAARIRHDSTVSQFQNANAEWLYNDKQNPTSGLTLRGTQFVECLKQIEQYNLPIDAQFDLAMAKFKTTYSTPPVAKTPTKPSAKRSASVSPKVVTEEDEDKILAEKGFAALVKYKRERGEA